MNVSAPILERLSTAFSTPDSGVLGLTDSLLWASLEQALRLDWREGKCRVIIWQVKPESTIDVSTTKSVIRAILARVAVLCNTKSPNSVSPYGGSGEVTIEDHLIRVEFVNTPETQNLELTPVRVHTPYQPNYPITYLPNHPS